jgi:AcrR family transcriptional regulator
MQVGSHDASELCYDGEMLAPSQVDRGRVNQKRRTRMAIVEAARELVGTGRDVSMPEIARVALVSEATAYRYFPDLISLLSEVFAGVWPSPSVALEPVADSHDVVGRVAFAAEYLFRHVLAYQGAVRAMIAATITRPWAVSARPGLRFGLIDEALAPMEEGLSEAHKPRLQQLKRDLAIVISAEALFSLIDLAGLTPDEAIASAIKTATTLTRAAQAECGFGPPLP